MTGHGRASRSFVVRAWADPIATWLHRAEIKIPADIDSDLELTEGALVFDRAAEAAVGKRSKKAYLATAKALRAARGTAVEKLAAANSDGLARAHVDDPLRDLVTDSGPWPLRVDRRLALVGSWYEMFPRSEGATISPLQSGTFATAAKRLPAIADMGFDVVYMPPIHPIGEVNRKGPNNTVESGPTDPGSP